MAEWIVLILLAGWAAALSIAVLAILPKGPYPEELTPLAGWRIPA